MDRKSILEAAHDAITKDRAATHGHAEQSFSKIADYWSVYLGKNVTALDVAQMMVLFKTVRAQWNPSHADNFVDQVGYAALAGDIADGML